MTEWTGYKDENIIDYGSERYIWCSEKLRYFYNRNDIMKPELKVMATGTPACLRYERNMLL